MGDHFFYDLVGQYGLYAIFFLAMLEGDITLLLAGVLAHGGFFGEYSFAKVLAAGTLGGVASDQIAYGMGRGFRSGVREYRFYRMARPRIERLTDNFGALSIFFSKYIYGLRWACCVFYGVGKMPYNRFLPLSLVSCFVWALMLTGAGYVFNVAITNLIGDFKQIGKFLLVLVVLGIAGFYFAERYWLSKKVEEANPATIQKLEHAAEEKLHEIGQEIQEHIHLPPRRRRKDSPKEKPGDAEGD